LHRLDINAEMIKTAKLKVPNARFRIADMTNFRLKEKFDVIMCLFSAIGYVQSFRKLVITLRNFNNHLADEGLVLVEPWIFRKDFREGTVSIDVCENENEKIVRMDSSKLTKSHWLMYFHYLIGINNRIKYVKEMHRMILADCEDYVQAFNLAGYRKVEFLGKTDWVRPRGVFVAMK